MSIIGADGRPLAPEQPAQGAAAPQGPAGDLIKDGTDQSFMADVVEPSRQVPVIVDFWAPWCGPCRQLGPVIEKAVAAAEGAVRLVKINIDENPQIAGQLRIQSIPAVIAFIDGQPADGFMGALPESQIRDFIKRLTGDVDGDRVTEALARAEQALKSGDAGGAAQDFAAVLQMDPENMDALGGLARCALAGGDPERARELIEQAPEPKKTHPAIAGVRAALALQEEAAGAPDLAAAERAAAEAPGDAAAQHELGRARIAAGDLDGAMQALLASIEADRTWNEEAARRLLLKVFDAAGPGSEAAKAGRRRLSSLLFS